MERIFESLLQIIVKHIHYKTMDIQKIAHIGTEGVLFIGMFVYFNNQVKRLRDENQELKDKLSTLTENTNKQLNNIYTALDYFKTNITPTPLPIQQNNLRTPNRGMNLGIKQRKVQFTDEEISLPKSKVKEIPINYSEDYLDEELGDELQELEEEELESKEIDTNSNTTKLKKK